MHQPDLLLAQIHAHQQALFDEAERGRLLRTAMRRRRDGRKRSHGKANTAAGRPAEGNLAGCGERAPAPAQ